MGDDMQDMQIMTVPKTGGMPTAQSMAMQVVTTDAQAAAQAIVAQENRKMMLGLADAQVRMRMIDRSADIEQTRLTEDGMTQRLDIQEDNSTKRHDLTTKVDTFRIQETNATKRLNITTTNETKRQAINATKDIELKRIEAENDFTKGIKQWVAVALVGAVVIKGPTALVPRGGGKFFWILLAAIVYGARRLYINSTELASDPKRLLSLTVLGVARQTGLQVQLPGPLLDAKKWLEDNASRPAIDDTKEPLPAEKEEVRSAPSEEVRSVTDPTDPTDPKAPEQPKVIERTKSAPMAEREAAQPEVLQRSATTVSSGQGSTAQLKDLLEMRGLTEYLGKMDELGYDLDALKEFSDADLEEMFGQISCKPGHKIKFKNLVKKDVQNTTTAN